MAGRLSSEILMRKRNAPPQARSVAVDERLFLQSVSRAIDVLEAYAADPRPKSLGEIAEAAGINKSAALRVGQALLSSGYIERAEDGRLALGRRRIDHTIVYLRYK